MEGIVWDFNNLPEMPGPLLLPGGGGSDGELQRLGMGRRDYIAPIFHILCMKRGGRTGGTAVASPRQESAGSYESER